MRMVLHPVPVPPGAGGRERTIKGNQSWRMSAPEARCNNGKKAEPVSQRPVRGRAACASISNVMGNLTMGNARYNMATVYGCNAIRKR